MKLFMIVSRVPWPLDKGDKLRAYHQARELAKNHEVFLCCLSDKKPDPTKDTKDKKEQLNTNSTEEVKQTKERPTSKNDKTDQTEEKKKRPIMPSSKAPNPSIYE